MMTIFNQNTFVSMVQYSQDQVE